MIQHGHVMITIMVLWSNHWHHMIITCRNFLMVKVINLTRVTSQMKLIWSSQVVFLHGQSYRSYLQDETLDQILVPTITFWFPTTYRERLSLTAIWAICRVCYTFIPKTRGRQNFGLGTPAICISVKVLVTAVTEKIVSDWLLVTQTRVSFELKLDVHVNNPN